MPVLFLLNPPGLGVRSWGHRYGYHPEELKLAGNVPTKFGNENFRAGPWPLPSKPGHAPLPTAASASFTLTWSTSRNWDMRPRRPDLYGPSGGPGLRAWLRKRPPEGTWGTADCHSWEGLGWVGCQGCSLQNPNSSSALLPLARVPAWWTRWQRTERERAK